MKYDLFPIGNAKCSIGSLNSYLLEIENAKDCCAIKESPKNPGHVKKCGQMEGPCKDHNECSPGHTCSINNSKLNKFMQLLILLFDPKSIRMITLCKHLSN